MKKMSCKQLGGPETCKEEFLADTFDEIAELSKKHGMEMFQKNDKAHLEAMEKMKDLMQKPEAMMEWMKKKKIEFEELHEEIN